MKKYNLPRGIRNNNPANIVRTGQRWLGLSKVQTDGIFCQFDDIKFGIRAFFILARTYRKKYGIQFVRSFIERFAPDTENDVDSYVRFILNARTWYSCGFLLNDLDYSFLLYWIIRYENNLSDISMIHYNLSVYNLESIRVEFDIKIC